MNVLARALYVSVALFHKYYVINFPRLLDTELQFIIERSHIYFIDIINLDPVLICYDPNFLLFVTNFRDWHCLIISRLSRTESNPNLGVPNCYMYVTLITHTSNIHGRQAR